MQKGFAYETQKNTGSDGGRLRLVVAQLSLFRGSFSRSERLLKTIIEAIFVSKTEKEKSLTVLKKYMKGTPDDILEETYQYSKNVTEEVPTPSLEIVKTALEILSYQYPQAKGTDPNPIIDTSIMKRIEQSGFLKTIYKK